MCTAGVSCQLMITQKERNNLIQMRVLGAISVICLAAMAFAQPPVRPANTAILAVTIPSGDAWLAFVQPGKVAKVLVKDGDRVKSGQLLIQQDDKAEAATVAQLKLVAEENIHIAAQQAQLDQKKVDLKITKEVFDGGGVSVNDYDHAVLDVTIAQLSLDLAKLQQSQDKLKYQEAYEHLQRMKLTSPIDGKVEEIRIHDGESSDIQVKVLRVVGTDPLWIEVPVPREQAAALKIGQTAKVAFPQQADLADATVIHIGAVLDAGSDTRTVKLELPNPTDRPAGEHVEVYFQSPTTAPSSGPTTSPAAPTK